MLLEYKNNVSDEWKLNYRSVQADLLKKKKNKTSIENSSAMGNWEFFLRVQTSKPSRVSIDI